MNRTSILEFAQALSLGAPDRTSTAQWVNFRCPLAPWRHKGGRDSTASFGVKVEETEHSHYWCFSCHAKGEFHQLAFELAHKRQQPALLKVGEEIRRQEFLGPRFQPPRWEDDTPNVEEAIKKSEIKWPNPGEVYRYLSAAGHPYLRDRGVDWATGINLDLRYDLYRRRIVFPVRDYTGRLAGFSGRRIDRPSFERDGEQFEADGRPYRKVLDYTGLRKSEFLLGEHRIRVYARPHMDGDGSRKDGSRRKKQRITLVEGLFDYAVLTAMGIPNVCAILGSYLTATKVAKLIQWGLPVLLFLDNDQAGVDCERDSIGKLFGRVPLLRITYPEGFEGADPASLPIGVVKKMYEDADLVLDKNL